MESLLVKTLNSQDNSTELQFMEKVYSDDVDIEMLTTKMEIFKVLLKDGDFLCLDDIIVKIKELLTPERKMINKVITVCKLILVDPATSAAGERSFSTARRLKTWLRLTMTQEPGAPNDGFLPNALKRCFRLSRVLLKLCRLILGCAIKFLSVRSF